AQAATVAFREVEPPQSKTVHRLAYLDPPGNSLVLLGHRPAIILGIALGGGTAVESDDEIDTRHAIVIGARNEQGRNLAFHLDERAFLERGWNGFGFGDQADLIASGFPSPLGAFVECSDCKAILKAAVRSNEQSAGGVRPFGKPVLTDERRF